LEATPPENGEQTSKKKQGVNGGSIAITAAKSSSNLAEDSAAVQFFLGEELDQGSTSADAWFRFARTVKKRQLGLRTFLGALKTSGKTVFALGASTKGNVLLESSGVDSSLVEMVGEINPDKYGKFLPGTAIPIVPEEEVISRNPDFLLLLPWHFRDSIVSAHRDYLGRGGRFLLPLPDIEIIGA